MLFNSLTYAAFLPITCILYWCLPARLRQYVLLAASLYFYVLWGIESVPVLVFGILLSYGAGIAIERYERYAKGIYVGSVLISVGILTVFKYLGFLHSLLAPLMEKLHLPMQSSVPKLALPIGLSFYTFQIIAYLTDVYQGKERAQKHFWQHALSVSFFAKIMQGPIEREHKLRPQLNKLRHGHITFDYDLASYSLKLMAVGYFKKLCIADGLAPYVAKMYDDPVGYYGFGFVLATFFYAIQLYSDFSGYSDIAIGTAGLFGLRLSPNFKAPYLAASIREFWAGWHMSLSGWLRDYIYIPLGGSRRGKLRKALNVMLTFLVSGIWHGANLTFVVWGAIHGALQVLEDLLPFNHKNSVFRTNPKLNLVRQIICVPITFCLVCVAWIFFRANTVSNGWYILTHLFKGGDGIKDYLLNGYHQMGMGWKHMAFVCSNLPLLFIYDLISTRQDPIQLVSRQRWFVRWPIYVLLLLVIALLSDKGVATTFIYMNF